MSDSNASKIMTIMKWDGRAASCPCYLAQTKVLAKFHDCSDAIDQVEIENCPTKTEYLAIMDRTPSS